MRRSNEPEERAQFSVAELLARYGEPTPPTGRRRRRAPDDAAGVDAVSVDTGSIETGRFETGHIDTGRTADTAAQPAVTSFRTGSVSLPVADRPGRHGLPQQYSPSPYRNGRGGEQWSPAVSSPSSTPPRETPARGIPAVRTPPVGQPTVFSGRRPLTATALSDEPATVQFPRLQPAPPAAAPGPNRLSSGGEPPAGLGSAPRAIPEQKAPEQKFPGQKPQSKRAEENTDHPWDGTEEPYDDEPDYGSPVREWAVMVAQIGIGVLGGATLWLICEWLWQQLPVVALVVALAVITGLVWVVRRVRRAEDLQTTVIAVLVGLFVTVSPAALLLVGGR
jgi:hypothetical protein